MVSGSPTRALDETEWNRLLPATSPTRDLRLTNWPPGTPSPSWNVSGELQGTRDFVAERVRSVTGD